MTKQIKLGDFIAKLTETLGIPHCPKCERRRLILNEIQKQGLRETLKRMRAAGQSNPKEDKKNLEKLINKLNDCCK